MVVLGTRGSELALWQARHVQQLLRDQAQLDVRLQIIRTAGDRVQEVSLAAIDGKGFFTKEIEEALLRRDIDLAVHSHKDLPTASPADLEVVAVPARGPVADCLLVRPEYWQEDLRWPVRPGARLGTGSARRAAQIRALCPEVAIADLRGNVPTRIRKLQQGQYDAIVLAKAGLVRLGLAIDPLRLHEFAPEQFIPAPAQGALAIQMRGGPRLDQQDCRLREAVGRLHDQDTALCVEAERLLLAALEGGCHLPLGAFATRTGGRLRLVAALGVAGGTLRRSDVTGTDPPAVAAAAHQELTGKPAV
jgi:hydroxymethylbilane synthase